MLLGHIALALVAYDTFSYTGASDFHSNLAAFGTLFFIELGQSKYHIPGSVKTLSKKLAMVKYLFTAEIIVQWVAPAAIVGLVLAIL